MTHTPVECRICKLVDIYSMEMPTPEEIGTIIAERVRRWIDEDGNYTFLYAELEDGSVLCDIGNGPMGDKYAHRIAALWNMAERLRLTTEEIEGRKIDNALYKLEELELMVERGDLKRRLQNAELLIERMKDELSRAKGKEECLYQDFKKGNALYLAENLRGEKLRMALWEIRHIIWKNARMRWYSVGFWKLLVPIFSIAHNALQPSEKSSEITMDKKPGAEATE